MLRMHRAIVVLVPIVMLIPDAVVAENQERYLLNCQLINRADEVYQRYCSGGSGQQGQLLCQDKACKLITTNFKSQYSQTHNEGIGTDIVSEVSKTVGSAVSAAGSATRGVSGVGSGTVSGGLGGQGGLGGP